MPKLVGSEETHRQNAARECAARSGDDEYIHAGPPQIHAELSAARSSSLTALRAIPVRDRMME